MMKNITLRKIICISVLISFACVLSIFDRYISLGIISLIPGITLIFPYFKLGIANIIVLIIIYNFDFKYSLMAIVLKSIIVALFSGSFLTTFLIGFGGTILSFVSMYFLKKVNFKSSFMIFVSMVSGFMHSLGQLLVTFLIYRMYNVTLFLIYSPFILATGIICGIIIGLITFKLNDLIKKHNLLKLKGD